MNTLNNHPKKPVLWHLIYTEFKTLGQSCDLQTLSRSRPKSSSIKWNKKKYKQASN